jgi:hypothetical protein
MNQMKICRKLTDEEIRLDMEIRGHKFKEIDKTNGYRRIKFICGNCKKESICNIQSKSKFCGWCNNGGIAKRHTKEEILLKLEKFNHTLIGTYISHDQKINYICGNCSNETSTTYNCISKKCKHCFKSRKITLEECKEILINFGHTFKDFFIKNKRSTCSYICNCGKLREASVNQIHQTCKYCVKLNKQSKNEKLFADSIREKLDGYDVKEIDRDILSGLSPTGNDLELDIVIFRDKKVIMAIEWNGEYFHIFKKTKTHDKIKRIKCKEFNIPLVIIKDRGQFNINFVKKQVDKIVDKILNKG